MPGAFTAALMLVRGVLVALPLVSVADAAGPSAGARAPMQAAATASPTSLPTPALAPGGRPPRIGLALSGGGARGIAHIGVLKVLEEMRVPVHCVTGTSMGAIVGGTYATGVSAAQLEKLVRDADWIQMFRDQPPRAEISMRRKVDDFKTLFNAEFGVSRDGLAVPKGLIAGVSIEAFFRVLAEPALGVSDFSRLPIPFAAMATDIETGESIALTTGSLSRAMRASMSVPGAIAPVEIDGRLLVDGGIANNLPIDEARKLCGDIVIAVNISTPPLKRKDITSALSVAGQLVNFLGKQVVDQQLKNMRPDDVLLAPELGDITAGSFERAEDAIRIGVEAARAQTQSLARYSLPPEQYAALRATQVAADTTIRLVDEVRIEGLERTNAEVLRALVQTQPGAPLSEEKLSADLRRVYGRGDFESIDYRISSDTGPRALVITPREKSWGPDYLRFGLGLLSDFEGENNYNLLVQYRKTWLNRLGGEWLTHAQVGQDTYLSSEYFQPLHERGIWIGSLYGSIGRTTVPVFEGDRKVAEYLVDRRTIGVDLGAELGTWGMMRLGPVFTKAEATVETGSPVFPAAEQDASGARFALIADQLDNAWFPRDGHTAGLTYYASIKDLGAAANYQKLAARASIVRSWKSHTLNLAVSGGTDLDSDMPAYESFNLGGPLRLSGFRINQLSGREFAFGRLMYYRRAVALPDLLGSGVYVGASAEAGRITDRVGPIASAGTVYSGSLFLGAATAAGPAFLGIGFGSQGAFGVYLLLGAP